jgi:hypothetical protein
MSRKNESYSKRENANFNRAWVWLVAAAAIGSWAFLA